MIYFIQDNDHGPIKIGTTRRLTQRIKTLRRIYGPDLDVQGVLPGSHQREKELHRQFSHRRLYGEWFFPGDDLENFVTYEAQTWDGKDEDEKKKPLIFPLPCDTHLQLRVAAAKQGLSMAAYVRMLVDMALDADRGRKIGKN